VRVLEEFASDPILGPEVGGILLLGINEGVGDELRDLERRFETSDIGGLLEFKIDLQH